LHLYISLAARRPKAARPFVRPRPRTPGAKRPLQIVRPNCKRFRQPSMSQATQDRPLYGPPPPCQAFYEHQGKKTSSRAATPKASCRKRRNTSKLPPSRGSLPSGQAAKRPGRHCQGKPWHSRGRMPETAAVLPYPGLLLRNGKGILPQPASLPQGFQNVRRGSRHVLELLQRAVLPSFAHWRFPRTHWLSSKVRWNSLI